MTSTVTTDTTTNDIDDDNTDYLILASQKK